MKITDFSSIFTLQNIKSSFSDAYNSTRIAKVKALGYGLIGCTVLKSTKMAFNAYVYPKGWDFSEEEKEAYQYLAGDEDRILPLQKMARLLLMDACCSQELLDLVGAEEIQKLEDDDSFIGQIRNELKEIILEYKNKDDAELNISLGLEKLYDRTAQLLTWPDYIKSLW